MGGGGSVTVGYEYYAGMHLLVCHGPVDRLNRILVGERVAWTGPVTGNNRIYVNAPDLFGGKEREGGVRGYVDVEMGGATQAQNAYLQAQLGADIPAFRGLCGLVLNQCLLSMINPYVKPWKPELTRWPKGWNEGAAAIGDDANPAHIIVECLTNREWGLGYNQSDLDLTAFSAAATTLAAEGFGLSLIWDRQKAISDFIQDILQHIDGAVYVDPRTGLFRLKLIRNDYIRSSLPLFGPSEIVSVDAFSRAMPADMPNTLTVKYIDREGKPQAVTVHDIGGLEATGQTISQDFDMPGVPTKELALRIAMRELGQLARPLAKATVTCTRAAGNVRIGDPIRIDSAEHGLADEVMRVVSISYGTLREGVVRMELIEDAFSLPAYSAGTSEENLWTSPYTQPVAATARAVLEAPYWTVLTELTGESGADQITGEAGVMMVGAGGMAADSLNYTVVTRQGSASFTEEGMGTPTPTGILSTAITPTTTSITLLSGSRLDEVTTSNSYAVIAAGTANEELVAVTAVNATTGVVTISRGVIDTVPKAHASGTRVMFISDGRMLSETQYLSGEAVDVRILTRTSLGQLSLAAAPTDTLTFVGRATRPYPPGNFRINTASFPASVSGPIAVSWAHRDRLTQTAYLVAQSEGNIGPEAGTTYTLRLYGQDGLLKRTETGLTGTSYTWTTETEDSGLAAISLVASSTVTYLLSATSQTATIPTATASGDLLLAWVMHRSNLTAPSGWTLVQNASALGGTTRHDLSLYQKTAGSGDAGTTTTWTQATANRMAVQIQTWRHPTGASIATSTQLVANNTSTPASVAYAAITPTAAYQVAVHGGSIVATTSGNVTITPSVGTLTTPSSVADNRLFVAYRTAPSTAELTGQFNTNLTAQTNVGEASVSVILTAATLDVPVNTSVRVRLSSVVGGRESYQSQDWTVARTI